ncbi:hypothetical protein LUTEI9C_80328 [Luteimonas sp. 9C]|nr:hypothetical protein LUTEI9C_80328 [Luteimonas sp. 9C]
MSRLGCHARRCAGRAGVAVRAGTGGCAGCVVCGAGCGGGGVNAGRSIYFEHAQDQSYPPHAGGESDPCARHCRADRSNDRRAAPGRTGWVGADHQRMEAFIARQTFMPELSPSVTGPFAPIPTFPRRRGKALCSRSIELIAQRAAPGRTGWADQSPPPLAGEGWMGANRQRMEAFIARPTFMPELSPSAIGPFAPIPTSLRTRGTGRFAAICPAVAP